MAKTEPAPNSKWTTPVMMKDCEIHCSSTCVALGPLFTDGDSKLIVAQGGHRGLNMKLKVFQGIEPHSDSSLADMPTAIVHFMNELSSIPSVAVAAGPSLLIYKNLKPFYKFTAPGNKANPTEEEVWSAAAGKEINSETFLYALRNISGQLSFSKMAPLSQTFLLSDPENRASIIDRYASKFAHSASITCISKITKSTAEVIDVLILGTEQCDLHLVDSQAFTIYSSLKMPAIPVTICAYGYFLVDYRIFVQTRDSLVFCVRKGELDNRAVIVSQKKRKMPDDAKVD
uniref:BBS1 domain-containing protein n=1 Tax=Caenorhabditis japonica TaxID=281687 RepID=A0A8R1HV28_CAEJA